MTGGHLDYDRWSAMAITTRARSRDEKRERRHEILGATAALFLETPYDRVTMAEVARRCGLAKGTLYLYFRTKEELFLALAERDLELFFAEVNGRVGNARPPGPEPYDPVAADVLGSEALATPPFAPSSSATRGPAATRRRASRASRRPRSIASRRARSA